MVIKQFWKVPGKVFPALGIKPGQPPVARADTPVHLISIESGKRLFLCWEVIEGDTGPNPLSIICYTFYDVVKGEWDSTIHKISDSNGKPLTFTTLTSVVIYNDAKIYLIGDSSDHREMPSLMAVFDAPYTKYTITKVETGLEKYSNGCSGVGAGDSLYFFGAGISDHKIYWSVYNIASKTWTKAKVVPGIENVQANTVQAVEFNNQAFVTWLTTGKTTMYDDPYHQVYYAGYNTTDKQWGAAKAAVEHPGPGGVDPITHGGIFAKPGATPALTVVEDNIFMLPASYRKHRYYVFNTSLVSGGEWSFRTELTDENDKTDSFTPSGSFAVAATQDHLYIVWAYGTNLYYSRGDHQPKASSAEQKREMAGENR